MPHKTDLPFELQVMQEMTPWNVPPENPDIVVALSGRATFDYKITGIDSGKLQREENELDVYDTYRRLKLAVNIARFQTELNKQKGLNKPVIVYFNGLKEHNVQLRKLLEGRNKFLGYPTEHFVVDDIPMNNTVGQCISLRLFLETNVDRFGKSPRLLFVSSTYHMLRVFRTVGCSSPLLSPDFYISNPGLMDALERNVKDPDYFTLLKEHLFAPDCVLKHAVIMGYGVDRAISERLGWKSDLAGELRAVPLYSCEQEPPSIAKEIPSNVISFTGALLNNSCVLMFRGLRISDSKDDELEEKVGNGTAIKLAMK